MKSNKIEKLGVLIPGRGAVASTFICGVIACDRGLAKRIVSMRHMGSIMLGKRTEDRSPIIKDFAPLAELDYLAIGGWDFADENVYEISTRSEDLKKNLLN
jgi:Myo-inositol-1-phosphate synthase.